MSRVLLLAVAMLALLAGCGGDAAEPESPAPAAAGGDAEPESPAPAAAGGDPDPVHVHGLGVDPADGSLLIATHNGLFRLAADGVSPRLVGESLHDLMGFTVVGPGHFLASGHPDLRGMQEEGLPPHLGLIESRDGGKTWRSTSLLGEADFHVLRVAGKHVYGFDATHARLLASVDGGESWSERQAPGFLIDVAPAPDDPDHLVATGERGLLRSRDGGRSWEPIGGAVGLLAWPDGGPLYLVDAGGSLLVAADGEAWQPAGEIGGEPAALLAAGPRELYVALHSGAIKQSADGGETWTLRFSPAG
jgi:hypothetical protein